jgi:hypothetical protein
MSFNKAQRSDLRIYIEKYNLPESTTENDKRPYDYDFHVFENNRDIVLCRQFSSDGHEWLERQTILYIKNRIFNIETDDRLVNYEEEGRKLEIKSIKAISNSRITRYKRSQLLGYLRALPSIFGHPASKIKFYVIDKTIPPKPRPITKLFRVLNKLASFNKECGISTEHVDFFVNNLLFKIVFSIDETIILQRHIIEKNGKGLSRGGRAIWDLGFEARKNITIQAQANQRAE